MRLEFGSGLDLILLETEPHIGFCNESGACLRLFSLSLPPPLPLPSHTLMLYLKKKEKKKNVVLKITKLKKIGGVPKT